MLGHILPSQRASVCVGSILLIVWDVLATTPCSIMGPGPAVAVTSVCDETQQHRATTLTVYVYIYVRVCVCVFTHIYVLNEKCNSFHCETATGLSQNRRKAWVGRNLKRSPSSYHAAMGRVVNHKVWLHRAPTHKALNAFRDGATSASLRKSVPVPHHSK